MLIALGGWPVFAAWQHGEPPSLLALPAVVLLLAAGIAHFLKKPIGFPLALGAGVFLAGTGVAGMATGQQLGMPLPSVVSLVAGLYVAFRAAIARGGLGAPAAREADTEDSSLAGDAADGPDAADDPPRV